MLSKKVYHFLSKVWCNSSLDPENHLMYIWEEVGKLIAKNRRIDDNLKTAFTSDDPEEDKDYIFITNSRSALLKTIYNQVNSIPPGLRNKHPKFKREYKDFAYGFVIDTDKLLATHPDVFIRYIDSVCWPIWSYHKLRGTFKVEEANPELIDDTSEILVKHEVDLRACVTALIIEDKEIPV